MDIFNETKLLVDKMPLSTQMNDYLNELTDLIIRWNVPNNVKRAALFLPWIDEIFSADFPVSIGLSLSEMELISEWYKLYQLTIVPPIGGSPEADVRSLKLRQLMRIAYLNIPLLMLTVLDHTARINASLPETDKKSFWEDTKDVFLPLLNMLGMWELRREWIEIAFKRLYPPEFNALENRLSIIREDQEKYVEFVQTEIDKWFSKETSITCTLRQPSAGRILYRSQGGESQEELRDMVTVSIVAPEKSDCYQTLEFLHTLGVPIRGRFSDYIAAPNANGYQGIHTTIIGNKKNTYGQRKVITFRIFTPSMNDINLWGIVKGLYQANRNHSELSVWWGVQQDSKAIDLIRQFNISSMPPTKERSIYVFTPNGEVKVLPKGSTALDFAYNIHTKIGHHCRSVQINGKEAPHSTVLENGDLVLLNHDPLFQGPDPAWLHITNNEKTRNKIKAGLRSIRQGAHPGRQHLERYLEALQKDSFFIVPEPQLEKYFLMAVDELGLSDVGRLFDAIVPASQHDKNSQSAEKLISFILSSELASAVVDKSGSPIVSQKLQEPSFSQPFLRFCPNCKPAPGSPLVLHRRKRGKYEKLTLHRKPQVLNESNQNFEQLFGLPQPDQIPCLSTIEPTELDENVKWGNVDLGRVAANITVLARDRSHLVGDLLLPIYENDRVNLTHIQATTDSEGIADILFVIEADTKKQITDMTNNLRGVVNVTKVSMWPVTLSQSAHYKTRYIEHLEIPYTPGPVRNDQMLFGRETQVEQIRQLLKGDNPQRLIIIRGQRRLGKTSLALLSKNFLPANNRTVYVDLQQTIGDPTPAHIYHTIIQDIYNNIKKTIPADTPEVQYLPPDLKYLKEQPGEIFFAYLHRIQELIFPHRLLLILDEFNVLVSKNVSETFFFELRSLITGDFPGISLMLVTFTNQEETLSINHPALAIFELGVPVELTTLDQISAKSLVEKPLASVLLFNEDVVNQLVNSSNGHPYIINLLCRSIVNNVWSQGRTQVRMEDLRVAVKELFRNGKNNFHFSIEKIQGQVQVHSLVSKIAKIQVEEGDWVELIKVSELANLTYRQAKKIARYLEGFDILIVREKNDDQSLQVRLAIEYFCQWIYRYWIKEDE